MINPEYDLLTVNKQINGSTIDLAATGEIDACTAPHLTREIINSIDASQDVSVDLGNVDFFSAAGINGLAEAAVYAALQNKVLRITNPSEIVRKLMEITGTESLLHTDE